MSFLAPLFALGAFAVAAPIIFHLIRRTSREKFRFSSLMFLQPTPPRMTRQSKLENILLLLLRCLILCLLALGFARPFIQKQMASDLTTGQGRRIAVLVDISASMQQSGLWNAARARAETILRSTTAADSVALYTFDQTAHPLLSFDQWSAVPAGDRLAVALKRLEETTPGWHATHLGNALITAVEAVEDVSSKDPTKVVAAERKVVVITDLQEGSRLDGLQGFEWPRGLEVDLQPLKPSKVTNAGLHLVGDSDERERTLAETEIKVRVNNASTSRREQFQVGWLKPEGNGFAGKAVDVYVPPGQSRVATIPMPVGVTGLERLRLTGDDEDFDNTVYHVPPKKERIRVLYLGSDAPTDSAQSLFYINRAFLETQRLQVEVLPRTGVSPLDPAEVAQASLLVAAGSQPAEAVRQMRAFLQSGHTVLLSLNGPDSGRMLADLLGLGTLKVEEANDPNYALFGQIDFQHPLFAPFADPRFSDFTKIHFWKHRNLDATEIKNARVIARFDRGAPAMLEIPVGSGSLYVLTSGWNPGDSQFALSSKFVPMIYSLLELSGAIKAQLAQYSVGDSLALTSTNAAQKVTVRQPSGHETTVAAGQRFAATDFPGVYTGTIGTEAVRFAVNIDPSESRTASLPIEDLERLGVPFKPPTVADLKKEAEKKERLKANDLEQRQKLWRWLLLAAILFLILETTVAAWITQRPAPASTPA